MSEAAPAAGSAKPIKGKKSKPRGPRKPAAAPTATGDASSNTTSKGGRFPAHWGDPPLIQTRDLRPLPGGYGNGSGTLGKWISENLAKDKDGKGNTGAAAGNDGNGSAKPSEPKGETVSAVPAPLKPALKQPITGESEGEGSAKPEAAAAAPTAPAPAPEPTMNRKTEVVSKKCRNLSKRLQKIEKIEDQLRTNPDVMLEKEQLAQLAKKGDITALADEFESLKTQFTKFDEEDRLAQSKEAKKMAKKTTRAADTTMREMATLMLAISAVHTYVPVTKEDRAARNHLAEFVSKLAGSNKKAKTSEHKGATAVSKLLAKFTAEDAANTTKKHISHFLGSGPFDAALQKVITASAAIDEPEPEVAEAPAPSETVTEASVAAPSAPTLAPAPAAIQEPTKKSRKPKKPKKQQDPVGKPAQAKPKTKPAAAGPAAAVATTSAPAPTLAPTPAPAATSAPIAAPAPTLDAFGNASMGGADDGMDFEFMGESALDMASGPPGPVAAPEKQKQKQKPTQQPTQQEVMSQNRSSYEAVLNDPAVQNVVLQPQAPAAQAPPEAAREAAATSGGADGAAAKVEGMFQRVGNGAAAGGGRGRGGRGGSGRGKGGRGRGERGEVRGEGGRGGRGRGEGGRDRGRGRGRGEGRGRGRGEGRIGRGRGDGEWQSQGKGRGSRGNTNKPTLGPK